MKRKRVYQVGYWILFIILLLTGSCQVEPDISEIIILDEEVQEDDTEELEVIDIIIDEPIIVDPEPIEEITTMEYRNNIDYHFPELLHGKSIRLSTEEDYALGQNYYFDTAGIMLPTEMMLYPNPVTPDMFINAVEGQTTESVEIVTTDDVETGFSYAIHMTGKFEYKGNLYYGEVKISVVYMNGVLTLNGLEGEFINE